MPNAPSDPYYQTRHSGEGQALGITPNTADSRHWSLQISLKKMTHNVASSALSVPGTTNSKGAGWKDDDYLLLFYEMGILNLIFN